MSKYLVGVSEIYRVDTENEVENLINNAKNDKYCVLNKYKCEQKERKAKGEVIDEWYKVQLDKLFNDEKDPDRQIEIDYHVPMGEF